jgi:hypothetical protein
MLSELVVSNPLPENNPIISLDEAWFSVFEGVQEFVPVVIREFQGLASIVESWDFAAL